MLRHITRLIAGVLAAGLLLALAPSASAAATYDITQVGDADWVSVTSNGRELSGQATASDGLQVTATVRLRIDDIGALREGDTVLVKATAASGSHFGPSLFSRMTLPPSLLDRRGNAVFTVSNADVDNSVLKLTRTGTTALGSYSCDLAATNKLWRWTPESKSSTWRIGKSSTYTFASRPQANSPCTSNNTGAWDPKVKGNSVEVNQWFLNCGTMASIASGSDASGFKTESQVGWAHVIPKSGRIENVEVPTYEAFVLRAIDGRTPGGRDDRLSRFYLSWRKDVDISTYDKAATNLPVGSIAVLRQEDGSWDLAYNIGSRLPGLSNSLKMPDSSDPTTLELQRNTGNMWQVASIFFCVRFRDESVPNRVSIETRGTEYALRSQTLTTKTIDPAVGQGQSAIRYDSNGGGDPAFTIDGKAVTPTVAKGENGNGFTATFDQAFIKANSAKQVAVTYKAVVTNAKRAAQASNTAAISTTFYDGTAASKTTVDSNDTATVSAYDLNIKKTNFKGDQVLQGAGFKIQNKDTGKWMRQDPKTGAWTYVDTQAEGTQFTTGANGQLNIAGLGAGNYHVVESKVPDSMTSLVTVAFDMNITDGGKVSTSADANKLITGQPTNDNKWTITVKNIDALTELPQTGGLLGNTMIGVIVIAMAGGVAYLTVQSKKRREAHAL